MFIFAIFTYYDFFALCGSNNCLIFSQFKEIVNWNLLLICQGPDHLVIKLNFIHLSFFIT